ncbi:50S ribosomal protein L10 [Peptoniphilus indolicus ATCC 29427]|uniref:Large ribosomal subunit protein uL10 n=1 Tax=Peptoniphilus indolicus ATCC 29427 TaxID=997350 RepID=G4D103_9FIRM|nr:50S ribosomal protein L10 [Peptoniphilus indolicus ATCC 29427]
MGFFIFGGEIVKEEKLNGKVQLVDEIKGKIESAQSIVLVNYRGLTVEEVTELRSKYREANVEYKVYKNTMMRRAFEELGQTEISEYLVGPSAIAFSLEDPVSAAKVTAEFAKEHEAFEIKSGIVDGKLISKEEVEGLAKLPSKEVLVAKLLGSMNSPIQGLVNVLNGNIRGLAVVLNAIAEKKEQETA